MKKFKPHEVTVRDAFHNWNHDYHLALRRLAELFRESGVADEKLLAQQVDLMIRLHNMTELDGVLDALPNAEDAVVNAIMDLIGDRTLLAQASRFWAVDRAAGTGARLDNNDVSFMFK